jgi:hypothetical protein
MSSAAWWLALPVLLLPIWWHRQKREQAKAQPLATARFVPRAQPDQVRAWRWSDVLLLLVRCLLLASVIAWLADPALPWRGDTVLVADGTDRAWAQREIANAGFTGGRRIELPSSQVLGWLRSHEREWRNDAKLLVLGDVPMPAARPRFSHRVQVRTLPAPFQPGEHHVAIVGERAAQWRRLFGAAGASHRFVIDPEPGARTELIVWDREQAPPAGLRAPLWWVGAPGAFPELANARDLDGVRYADSGHGRLWTSAAWPPKDAEGARRLFEDWQRLHHAPAPFTMPPQALPASHAARTDAAEGALRDILALVIAGVFALERILTHARRR